MTEDKSIPKITVQPSAGSPASGNGQSKRASEKTMVLPDTKSRDVIPSSEPLNAKYVILEKIGDGGMGIVYLAQDKKLGRYVAIKRLNSSSLSRPSLRKRFFQEAKAIAALRHIHIVHVYSLSEDDDGPYIVMEYVSGPPESSPNKTPPTPFALDDKVHRDGPMPTGEALDLIIKLSRAVEYAHSCGIIHRDLKPSNILFDEAGEPKIVDFGLARTMEEGIDQLTVPGEKMLSLGYGAPEQERDASKTDERADVYGLGALLYFSLTGQNPRYFRPDDVPESIRMVIVKALEPDRNKRWSRARELLDALLLIKAPSIIELPTVKRTWRCTWCDTVNPVSIRYCGKCGWDGGVLCAECGSEIRVGIPFCGHCGADARDYEIATRLSAELLKHWERKEYRNIMERAGSISSFTPGGPEGRKLVTKIYDLQKKAETALKRREKLRQMIPMDISTRDYERARSHIEEYNNYSNDNTFAEELSCMDSLIIRRDLDLIVRDIETKKWEHALELCTHLLSDVDPYNADVRKMLQKVRYHRIRVSVRNFMMIIIICFLAYILSAAPVYRLMGGGRKGVFSKAYGLVFLIHDFTGMSGLLDSYAEAWESADMFKPADEHDGNQVKPNDKQGAKIELAPRRAEYDKKLKSIINEYRRDREAWPAGYIVGIQRLQSHAQVEGDYEGWESMQTELDRFNEYLSLTEADVIEVPVPLKDLQTSYIDKLRKIQTARVTRIKDTTDEYMAVLTKLRTDLTKAGKMEKAKSVNDEIERIKGSPLEYLEEKPRAGMSFEP